MAVFVNSFFEKRVEQLFDLASVIEKSFSEAGLEYRIVGGLAVYLYVEEAEPDAGRLTSFRLTDAAHLEDLDQAGLITAEIEATLPTSLHERLAQVRDRE